MMPQQKPGSSKQDYGTPWEFIAAVQRRFGALTWDLAAHAENTKVPGSYITTATDSLSVDWHALVGVGGKRGPLWLNPEYARIAPWAAKCATEARKGAEILFLVPASVGANWYWEHVAPYAAVECLSPRLSFDGKAPYPKDLILAHYGPMIAPAFRRWQWLKEERQAA